MRPQLLQLSSPLPGQFVDKRAGTCKSPYLQPQDLRISFRGEQHVKTCDVTINWGVRKQITSGIELYSTSYCTGYFGLCRHDSSLSSARVRFNLASRTFACLSGCLRQKQVLRYASDNRCPRHSRGLYTFRIQAESGDSRKSWWKRFLFTPIDPEEFPFLSVENFEYERDGELEDADGRSKAGKGDDWVEDDIDRMLADDAKYAEWQQRIKAQTELRESQKVGWDPGNADWEDWLDESWGDYSDYVGGKDSGWYFDDESDWEKGGLPRIPPKLPERGMSRTMKEYLFRIFDDEDEVLEDLAFEDRVFRFTSQTTVKFVAILVVVPWIVGYISHDFVIVPFLNRWVEKVPLAAEMLDLRESQKLKLVDDLKLERQRVRFEAVIGKAPPLTDDELLEHIREEAIERKEEIRLENRKAFGNIWSDTLAGATVLLLLVCNPDKVAIMRLTGTRLFMNISDSGKAFIIILLSDIFLGYHSESGWETVVEMLLEHYGFEAEKAAVYLFVATVPVTIDACFKLWVFRFLTRISPSAVATFKEMKRH